MKQYIYLLIVVLFLGLTGCSSHFETTEPMPYPVPGPVVTLPGETVTITVPAPAPNVAEDVAALAKAESDYREGLGQSILSNGLSCTLYTITGGDRIQASIPGHNTLTGITQVASFTYRGIAFNQANSNVNTYLNVLPESIRSLYTNMYLLRCQGHLVVTQTGYYNFQLTSDDGSLLYIGGSKVIDNDNGHAAVTVSGQKHLRRGVHAFRLDFAQSGGGQQALLLKANGDFIDGMYLYH